MKRALTQVYEMHALMYVLLVTVTHLVVFFVCNVCNSTTCCCYIPKKYICDIHRIILIEQIYIYYF